MTTHGRVLSPPFPSSPQSSCFIDLVSSATTGARTLHTEGSVCSPQLSACELDRAVPQCPFLQPVCEVPVSGVFLAPLSRDHPCVIRHFISSQRCTHFCFPCPRSEESKLQRRVCKPLRCYTYKRVWFSELGLVEAHKAPPALLHLCHPWSVADGAF